MGGSELYRAIFLSPEGAYVRSSCGGGFETTTFGAAPEHLDMIFVIAGANRFLSIRWTMPVSCVAMPPEGPFWGMFPVWGIFPAGL